MVNVAAEVESAKKLLERALQKLAEAAAKGPCDVAITNEIDRIRFAIESLDGDVQCPSCGFVLSGGREEED